MTCQVCSNALLIAKCVEVRRTALNCVELL
jgi:hypothetical protein